MGKWTSCPNFDDRFAKVREEVHRESGAKRIDILYGARDPHGNPTSPASSRDGHGHIIALEVDGLYQIISWRHPAYEGGGQEYGGNRRDNPLKDLENDIARKSRLCERAEALRGSFDVRGARNQMRQIFDEWRKVYNWDTPKERELWRRFSDARKHVGEAGLARNKSEKQRLVDEARRLSDSTEWRNANQKQKELMAAWKKIGPAGKDEDDRLWEAFKGARQRYYDRREAYFKDLDRKHAESRRAKEAILSEAKGIANSRDYSREHSDRMKGLFAAWKAAGSAGKEHDERLWTEFQSVRDAYYEGSHREYERRKSERRQRLVDAISRKEQQISNLWGQIGHLQDKLETCKNQDYIRNMVGWIDEKKAEIRKLECDIQDIKSKL